MSVIVREKVRGSGEYWIFVTHQGHRKAKKVGSKQAAEKAAKILEAKIALGTFGIHEEEILEVPTVEVYSKLWLSTCIQGVLDDMTHERYGYVLKRDILSGLGAKPLDKVGPKDIRDLLNRLKKAGRTAKSVSLTRTVLSSLFSEAVIEGLIQKNPVAELHVSGKRSKTADARRPKQHRVDWFTQEEVAIFLDYVMSKSPDDYGPMFFSGFRAGPRLGELSALHWEDIDWERHLIHVRRMFKRGRVKPVKEGKDRFVDMSSQLQSVLEGLLIRRKQAAAQNGSEVIPPMIFHVNGRYRAQNTIRKMFKKFLKDVGLREIRFHDIRHTFASLLIMKGANLAYLKEQLGHASIKTTVDTYGHLVPGSLRDFVNSLDTPVATTGESDPGKSKPDHGNEQNRNGDEND